MTAETRMALHEEIERTLDKFHRLLVTIPFSALSLPSRDSAWTNADVLYGISVSPLTVQNILRRNRGQWTSSLVARIVTGSLIRYDNEAFIRSHARNVTLAQLATAYQHNCDLILQLLDEIQEDSFQNCVRVDEGIALLSHQANIEQLFHYVEKYYDMHRTEILINR
jgi:hypothetical protein